MTYISESPAGFIARKEGVEAVMMPIGAHDAQLVLIASDGEWLRYVVPSLDDAKVVCERLGIEGHEGYPDHLRQRMALYRRTPEDWASAPYPERTRGTSV
ncbi:MAG: hypothetical protein ABR507_05140 [Actinomycetota bacterium]|nr:hypothetical protein [Actinomycetota bacterium]